MGDVYKAHDTRLDRDVAIKILSSQLAGDPDAVARFEREALSVAKLSHPNILAIYEFGRARVPDSGQDVAFVVTELVDGETLRARLAHGPLQPRRAVGYAQQIARGIAAAHVRGIVHRDLKPENVMITRTTTSRFSTSAWRSRSPSRRVAGKRRARSTSPQRRAPSSARSAIWRPSRSAASRLITARTSSRLAPCSTRCCGHAVADDVVPRWQEDRGTDQFG
jgi:serine/threonine-protein kinase